MLIVVSLSVLSLHGMEESDDFWYPDIILQRDIHDCSSGQARRQQGSIIEAQAVAQQINPTEQTLLTAIHQTLCAIFLQSEESNRRLAKVEAEIRDLKEELRAFKIQEDNSTYTKSGSHIRRDNTITKITEDTKSFPNFPYYQALNEIKKRDLVILQKSSDLADASLQQKNQEKQKPNHEKA